MIKFVPPPEGEGDLAARWIDSLCGYVVELKLASGRHVDVIVLSHAAFDEDGLLSFQVCDFDEDNPLDRTRNVRDVRTVDIDILTVH